MPSSYNRFRDVPADDLGAKTRDVLLDAVAKSRRWLELPDAGRLLVPLAAVVANMGTSDPLWLLEVAASSSGKTEALGPLARLPYVHPVGSLTEAALLSGTPKKEKAEGSTGGLLRQVGDFGIILARDFSAILAMRQEPRAAVLAALREVYDGHWTRAVGTDGGKLLSWSGKCGFIGAVTPSIDRHHAVMGTLGERFLLYRPSTAPRPDLGRRRIANAGAEAEMRGELGDAVAAVLDAATIQAPTFSDDEKDRLVLLSTYIAAARTGVDRDGYRHEVEAMPEPEAPGRLIVALANLATGLRGIGADEDDVWRLTTEVAWGCVPEMRRRLLHVLRRGSGGRLNELAEASGVPRTSAERALDDLRLLGLVTSSRVVGDERSVRFYALNEGGDAWPNEPETYMAHMNPNS